MSRLLCVGSVIGMGEKVCLKMVLLWVSVLR